MIRLKQVIKYDNANALEATWVDDVEIVTQIPDPEFTATEGNLDAQAPLIDSVTVKETPVRCHAYDQYQMDMLRVDVGDEMTEEIEELIDGVLRDAVVEVTL